MITPETYLLIGMAATIVSLVYIGATRFEHFDEDALFIIVMSVVCGAAWVVVLGMCAVYAVGYALLSLGRGVGKLVRK
jgi:hypothetical protein